MKSTGHPSWRSVRQAALLPVPRRYRSWLLDTGSLTQRLKAACDGRFSVRVLRQVRARPQPGESALLGMRAGEHALIREVHLLCDQTPWVYARTVIPQSTLKGACRQLAFLGDRPLGAFLFADPGLRRDRMELACMRPGQAVFAAATRGLSPEPEAVWARRSLFRLHGKPLLVGEAFLPAIPAFDHGIEHAWPSGVCDGR